MRIFKSITSMLSNIVSISKKKTKLSTEEQVNELLHRIQFIVDESIVEQIKSIMTKDLTSVIQIKNNIGETVTLNLNWPNSIYIRYLDNDACASRKIKRKRIKLDEKSGFYVAT